MAATRPLAVGKTSTASVPRARVWPEPQSYSEGTQLSKTLRFPFTQTLMKSARNHILRPESHGLLPSREGELLFS